MPDHNRFAECNDISALLRQLSGAASMCWENVSGAGVFLSEDALDITVEAEKRLSEILGAAGWRKVDTAADTRTEWAIHDHLDGVTSPVGQLNAEERTRMFAKHRPHISVRSRDVITTPWREVES